MAENYELNVNVDGVNECIDALDSAKNILDGCQADVDDKVASINCLPHGNAGNLFLSVEPFDALDISNLQYQLHSVLDQIEDYNRANSSGEGNWFSNFVGGIVQGGAGVIEGLVDGAASIALDIGDAIHVSGEWENGLANRIKEDWSYKAGYAVGNALSGGKGYDENSGWAVAGKATGTMVTYGAISLIPGAGGVVVDAAMGGLSGYGQGTQKSLRKQGIQTESEWANTLNNETVGRSDAVSKKAVSNSKATAAVEAGKGVAIALAANGLFKLGGKVISKVKGKGVSATSGLDDAASVVSKADDVANAADDVAEGGLTGKVTKLNDKIAEMSNKNADEIIDGAGKSANGVKSAASKVDDVANAADDAASAVSKADDTFRESGQKLVDAQTKLDEGYKSGMSKSELGKLEEARDAAKREFSDAGGHSQELMDAASEKVNASRKLQELGDRADAPSDSYYFQQLDEGLSKRADADSKISQLLFRKTDDAAKSASKSADDVAGAVAKSASKSADDVAGAVAKSASKSADDVAAAASKVSNVFKKHPIATTTVAFVGGFAAHAALNNGKANNQFKSTDDGSKSSDDDDNSNDNSATQQTSTGNQPYSPQSGNGGSPGGGGGSSGGSGVAQYRDSSVSTTAPATVATTPPTTAAPTTAMTTPPTTTAPPSTTSTTVPPSTTSTTASPITSTPITASPVTTAPSTAVQNTTTVHTGGGYSGTGGYMGTGDYTGINSDAGITNGVTDGATDDISDITNVLDDGTTSIEDVIKGSKYTRIPTSSKPVTTTSSSGSSAVIPIAAGLSAAAAAGIGAKAYMDRKKNNDNGEDDEEFDSDEWTGDDAVDIQYDDSSDMNAGENVLDADDDYSYQPAEETEKYDARSSDELADLQ